MCGVCGIVDHIGSGIAGEKTIKDMCRELRHRGPDDGGIYLNNGIPSVALGHRRLSIIDLSQAGHQPMSNEDGSVQLVFNGEIYNYKDLKDELKMRGHIFKSDSDTEVMVHLYETYGEECVRHLRGMFAFAVWDEKNKNLFLGRDRVGKKPLLYCRSGNIFCFASEFSSILASGLINKSINLKAVDYYMNFGYVPAPFTIYNGVFKLPAAHTLTLKDGNIRLEPYWQVDYSGKINISEEEASEEVLRLLKEAVKIRLYSDVPLGAFLSGGIDSSAVVGLMSQVSGAKVKTFSIGFEESDYNELKYARMVARKFATEHHEFIVKPNALEILPLLVERYGEPYADSSCIPTYYVCRETRRFVTVALNGDGGDEAFGGYERYQAMLISENLQKLPIYLRNMISGLAGILPDSVNQKDTLRRLKRFLGSAGLPAGERYLRWAGILGEVRPDELYSDEFLKETRSSGPLAILEPYLNRPGKPDLLDRLLLADTSTYLPDDLLVKVDIASMANSLEARSPFLDHKLIEFAAKLPSDFKIRRGTKKYILRKAVKGLLPEENIRRRKMGFGMPVGQWFRGELKGFLCDTVLSAPSLKRGYFKPGAIKRIVEDHTSGKKDYAFQLWAILMLELWHKKFMDTAI
ncbi:MAG: asparagine synthase (glutamine-hydrolyzing) [Candidatus Omnitrophica bacterium]|nr:asparagine synthase (glutamine-hydrolyzing) [Candidatus Omnitrophota bacterium]